MVKNVFFPCNLFPQSVSAPLKIRIYTLLILLVNKLFDNCVPKHTIWCDVYVMSHRATDTSYIPSQILFPYIHKDTFFSLSRKLETEGLIHNFLLFFCSVWRKSINSRLLNSSLGINDVWVWKDQYTSSHLHLSEDFYGHLFEFAVQVELPPVKVVGEEGVIVCAAVTGVGQDVAATLGEAEEDVSRRKINSSLMMDSWKYCWQIFTFPALLIAASSRWLLACWMKQGRNRFERGKSSAHTDTDPSSRNSSLTMFFRGTHTRGGSFLKSRCENWPVSWKSENERRQHTVQQDAESVRSMH